MYTSYNQLLTHPSTHVESERKAHTTSRLQQHTQRWVGALSQSHPGLCGTPVGPGKDTHGTSVPKQGRPSTKTTKRHPTTRHRPASRQTCFQETKCRPTLGNLEKLGKHLEKWRLPFKALPRTSSSCKIPRTCLPQSPRSFSFCMCLATSSLDLQTSTRPSRADRKTVQNLHGSGAARRSHGKRAVNEHVVIKVEVEKSRNIKKISQRNETHHPGDRENQDSAESVHKQSCCCDCCEEKKLSLRIKRCTERVGEGNPTSEFGLDLRYSERQHATFSARHSK